MANEFLDLLTCYDLQETGLDKLKLKQFKRQCEPFEEEVVSRLASMCPHLLHLELSDMNILTEAGRM